MVSLWLVLGCSPDPINPKSVFLEEDSASAAAVAVAEFNPLAPVTRASLDLRGVRPSPDEIAEYEADPDNLDDMVDRFMADPRFHDQVMALYSEVFRTPSERISVPFSAFGLEVEERPEYLRSIGEEPLRILARIADEDLPLTELVTGDWTMANEMLGRIWPLDYPDTASGWQIAHYTDERPSSGVLSTNSLWWRYSSTEANLNRGRANQISRIFLCHDHLTRVIDFDAETSLLDDAAVADAVQSDPGCVSCHVSLDPIASYLFGFWYYQSESAADTTIYHPERELLWESLSWTPPSFYGAPGTNLSDLGRQIAGDPRFVSCAVERAFTRLMRRSPSVGDSDALTVHREALLDGGLRLRPLFKSIVTHPRYRPRMDPTETGVPGAVERKMVTAEQLASQVAALTDFVWSSEGYDMLRTDELGLGNLAGRADGVRMRTHTTEPNITLVLVQERLAEAAALYAVAQEQAQAPGERRLFTELSPVDLVEADPDRAAAQVQAMMLLVLSRRVEPDDDDVADLLALWEDLYAKDGEPDLAWAGVLAALLRDPDFLLY